MLTLTWRAVPYHTSLAEPLGTGAGSILARSGWYLICSGAGIEGLGEVAPWALWGTEPHASVAAVLAGWPGECAAPDHVADVAILLLRMGLDRDQHRALWAGAELALLDWLAKHQGVPLYKLLGPGEIAGVPVAGLVGTTDPVSRAVAAVASGHRTLKLKVGVGTVEEDAARVLAVRAAVGPDVVLRLDANGAWPSVEAAFAALTAFVPAKPVFVEQPVHARDRAGMAELVTRSPVPIAADESLGTTAAEALMADGLRVLVYKPMLLGGILGARDLIVAGGVTIVLSSALDRGVGTAGVLHLAAAFPDLPASGLDTARLYADGGALVGLVPVNGEIAVPTAPGLGMASREKLLELPV